MAALVGGILGVALGAGATAWSAASASRSERRPRAADLAVDRPAPETVAIARTSGLRSRAESAVVPSTVSSASPELASLLMSLRVAAVLVGPNDELLASNAAARRLGLGVKGSTLAPGELRDLVGRTRADHQGHERQLKLSRGRGRLVTHVAVRVAPLDGNDYILALLEDRTRERRVDAIRRDFVANVSHELKTPVGALNLLAEAISEAADDPEAVQRFSARMRVESERLTKLVQQVIELSRLQNDDPLERADPVDVDTVVERAIDRMRVDAEDKRVELRSAGDSGLLVMGDMEPLISALGNLVENAVAFSAPGKHVTVTVKGETDRVEIGVADHGVGIAPLDLDRIFERFYRVDPARTRATGGSGLGLAIVKHIAATHGGEVRVWSAEGDGSTFTLVLPLYASEEQWDQSLADIPLTSAQGRQQQAAS
ncbi:MAG: ATP-binding protein [Nocardioidaceae bacterium]